MIQNERQYRIAKAQITKFEAALEEAAARPDRNMRLRRMEEDALRSQLQELNEEVQEYERLRSGKQEVIHLDSLDALPRALVQARIASGLSQKELAERLGLKEQQIQRYEATGYASANLERITAVIEALGVKIAGEMTRSVVGGAG